VIGCPERVTLARDPDYDPKDGLAVEFRLTYEGILLGASRNSPRPKHKHEIRKTFHKQLRQLFKLHPAFDMYHFREVDEPGYQNLDYNNRIRYEEAISNFERGEFRFFPLATRNLSLLCGINILFLRPDVPGTIISSGDIDNRLKTIFDALRMPRDKAEAAGYSPDADEDPFFCLLEDDSLISHVSVETDTLLQPTGASWERNDSRLVITVRLAPYRVTTLNLAFGG
jgi:hypothetical protein